MKKLLTMVITIMMTLTICVNANAATGTSFDTMAVKPWDLTEIPLANADANKALLELDHTKATKVRDDLYHVWYTGDQGAVILELLMEKIQNPLSVNLWEAESRMDGSVNGNTRVEILDTGSRVKYDIEVITETGHMVCVEYVLKWSN